MPCFAAFFRSVGRHGAPVVALLAATFAAPAARAQAPAWVWAEAINQSAASAGVVAATATDAAGNVYLAGSFADVAVFGSTTLTSAGSTDAFVAKYDPMGRRYLWAVRAGGAGGDEATSISVRGTSVFVGGRFASATASYGSTTLTNASTSGGNDAFVMKLVDAGSSAGFGWVRGFGGVGDDQALAVLSVGVSVYVAGSFQGRVPFGTFSLLATGLSRDGFVFRIIDSSAGSFVDWAIQMGGAEDDSSNALTAGTADIFVAGTFGGTTATFGNTILTNAGGPGTTDAFVARIGSLFLGTGFGGAYRAGGLRNEAAYAVTKRDSAVYVAGSFDSPTLVFNAVTLTNADATSATPNADGFVARLTDNGLGAGWTWATAVGGLGTDEIQTLAVAGSAVYAGGYFDGATVNFGPHVLTAAGTFRNEEIAVARLRDNTSSGTWVWAQRAGGTGDDRALALSLGSTGVYVGGYITPPGSFGSTTFSGPTGTLAGTLASLTDPLLGTAAPVAAGGLAVFPSPAQGVATVRLPGAAAGARVLALVDALGRPVRRIVVPVGVLEAPLDVRGLCAGWYVLCGEGLRGRVVVE